MKVCLTTPINGLVDGSAELNWGARLVLEDDRNALEDLGRVGGIAFREKQETFLRKNQIIEETVEADGFSTSCLPRFGAPISSTNLRLPVSSCSSSPSTVYTPSSLVTTAPYSPSFPSTSYQIISKPTEPPSIVSSSSIPNSMKLPVWASRVSHSIASPYKSPPCAGALGALITPHLTYRRSPSSPFIHPHPSVAIPLLSKVIGGPAMAEEYVSSGGRSSGGSSSSGKVGGFFLGDRSANQSQIPSIGCRLSATSSSLTSVHTPLPSSSSSSSTELPFSSNHGSSRPPQAPDSFCSSSGSTSRMLHSQSFASSNSESTSRSIPRKPVEKQLTRGLSIEDMPQKILNCQYAVRGDIVTRALQIETDLQNHNSASKFPFASTLPANIGNPQAVGQVPITFHRQVLCCLLYPELIKTDGISKIFPSDVIRRAQRYLRGSGSVGAYSHSKGVPLYREDVAAWLSERDGCYTDPESVFLTDGASPGVRLTLELLLRDETDGVLIPIPQYPLYSATIARLGGTAIHYYLKEEANWSLESDSMETAINEAKDKGVHTKAMVVINPGNPTGAVFSRRIIEQVCSFCASNGLVLLADEVYQENVYGETPFVSCRKVAHDLGLTSLEVITFHSCSKGLLGECGLRGGVLQAQNILPQALSQMYKLSSISLCSNTIGQALMASSVNPPRPGDESYPLYREQTGAIYSGLQRKAKMVCDKLNEMEGVSCQPVDGAMYAYPTITLPERAVEEARKQKVMPDLFYCLRMLEQTGVITVPGSGFGQKKGTWHYRMTILPKEENLATVMANIAKFHSVFMKTFA